MNKYLVKIYIPLLGEKYDVLIPSSKRIKDIIYYVCDIVSDLTDNEFVIKDYDLISKITGNSYDKDLIVGESDIKNGEELIII